MTMLKKYINVCVYLREVMVCGDVSGMDLLFLSKTDEKSLLWALK